MEADRIHRILFLENLFKPPRKKETSEHTKLLKENL